MLLLHYCNFVLQDIVIQQDDEIRLRIVGTRVDANDIVSTTVYLLVVHVPCLVNQTTYLA